MKKRYEAPNVEIVKFEYSDQVVATSGCQARYINFKDSTGACSDPSTWKYYD